MGQPAMLATKGTQPTHSACSLCLAAILATSRQDSQNFATVLCRLPAGRRKEDTSVYYCSSVDTGLHQGREHAAIQAATTCSSTGQASRSKQHT